jgi:glycosyltransferase involved in cell wall biosynthesis
MKTALEMLPDTRITVLVPTHNHENYIDDTLRSIEAQDLFSKSQVILSDDGSTDATFDVLDKFAAQYDNVCALRNDAPKGIIPHYRRLVSLTKTRYVTILEGDDLWLTNRRLATCKQFLENHPACDCVFTGFDLVDSEGLFIETRPKFLLPNRSGWLHFEDLATENHISSFSNCFYKTSALKDALNSTGAMSGFDWYINLFLALRSPIGYIGSKFSAYRIHGSGTWSKMNQTKRREGILNTLKAVQEISDPRRREFLSVELNSLTVGSRTIT